MVFQREFEHSEKLIDAALEEFIAYGYEQASINVILEKAGMSKGQFYYHFKNKEGLYLALIDFLITKKKEFLASATKPEDECQDIFTLLKLQIRRGMDFAREYPAISRFAESFLREEGNAIYHKSLSVYNIENNEPVMSMVKRAYDKGDFRADLPLAFVQKLTGYLFTHVADLVDLSAADQFESGVDLVIDFIQYGLAKTHPAHLPGRIDLE